MHGSPPHVAQSPGRQGFVSGEKRNRPAPPPERGLLVPGPSPGPEAPLFPKPLDLGQHWVVVR